MIGGFTGFESISNVNIFRLNQLALIELNRSFDFALRFYIFFYSTIELQMHNIVLLFARYNSYCFTSFKHYCSSWHSIDLKKKNRNCNTCFANWVTLSGIFAWYEFQSNQSKSISFSRNLKKSKQKKNDRK